MNDDTYQACVAFEEAQKARREAEAAKAKKPPGPGKKAYRKRYKKRKAKQKRAVELEDQRRKKAKQDKKRDRQWRARQVKAAAKAATAGQAAAPRLSRREKEMRELEKEINQADTMHRTQQNRLKQKRNRKNKDRKALHRLQKWLAQARPANAPNACETPLSASENVSADGAMHQPEVVTEAKRGNVECPGVECPARIVAEESKVNIVVNIPFVGPGMAADAPTPVAVNEGAIVPLRHDPAVTFDVELKVNGSLHILSLPLSATAAMLSNVLKQRFGFGAEDCRLVPMGKADLRIGNADMPLVAVLGSGTSCASARIEVMPRLSGGSGKRKGADVAKKNRSDKIVSYTTISGLGLRTHIGPDVSKMAEGVRRAIPGLQKAIEKVVKTAAQGVRCLQQVVESGLYLWLEHLRVTNYADFDAALFSAVLSTELYAGAFGKALFAIAAGVDTAKGSKEVPAKLKELVEVARGLFVATTSERAKKLLAELGRDCAGLEARYKEFLQETGLPDVPSDIRAEAGSQFGVAIRQHTRADALKALKRMLKQAIKCDVGQSGLELSDKVSQLYLLSVSPFRHFAISLFRHLLKLVFAGCLWSCRCSCDTTVIRQCLPRWPTSCWRVQRAATVRTTERPALG